MPIKGYDLLKISNDKILKMEFHVKCSWNYRNNEPVKTKHNTPGKQVWSSSFNNYDSRDTQCSRLHSIAN